MLGVGSLPTCPEPHCPVRQSVSKKDVLCWPLSQRDPCQHQHAHFRNLPSSGNAGLLCPVTHKGQSYLPRRDVSAVEGQWEAWAETLPPCDAEGGLGEGGTQGMTTGGRQWWEVGTFGAARWRAATLGGREQGLPAQN